MPSFVNPGGRDRSLVDRRYEFAAGYQPSEQAHRAKDLARRFLGRSRRQGRIEHAYGGSTRRPELGTGGMGYGFMGTEVTPQQMSAPIVTSLRRQQMYDSKQDFISSEERVDQRDVRPRASRGSYYSSLRGDVSLPAAPRA